MAVQISAESRGRVVVALLCPEEQLLVGADRRQGLRVARLRLPRHVPDLPRATRIYMHPATQADRARPLLLS